MFANRQQAGLLLAREVSEFLKRIEVSSDKAIVLALPRGGVPVALEIALMLSCPLDVLASKKIGAPSQPELAMGAVTSDGTIVVDRALIDYLGASPEYLEAEKEYLVNRTKMLEETWRRSAGIQDVLDFDDKCAIVVDDGVATGMTAIAAVRSLREQGAKQIIFAAPVASTNAFGRLEREYDQIIALEVPSDFRAVGQFYLDFNQVEDMEVVRALTLAANKCQVNAQLR